MSRKNRQPDSPPGVPGWVKAFGVAALVVALLVVVLMASGHAGQHGPAQHLPGGQAAVTLQEVSRP